MENCGRLSICIDLRPSPGAIRADLSQREREDSSRQVQVSQEQDGPSAPQS
jgi:hypothetical protein